MILVTEQEIDRIAKPFIRELGGDYYHSGEDGIRDDSSLYEFVTEIELLIQEKLLKGLS